MSALPAAAKENPNLKLKDRIDIIKNKRGFSLAFPLTMLACIIAIFSALTNGDFLTRNVLMGIFNQSIIVGTMATAVCFIYTTGNVDFSVGSVMGLAAAIGALAYQTTQSMTIMIVLTVVSGVVLMLLNCTMGVLFNVKSAMVAIVAMSLYSAIAQEVVGPLPLAIDYQLGKVLEGNFRYIAFGLYFGLCLLVYHNTAIGRKLRLIGGNEKCAVQTGINTSKIQYAAFLLAGIGVGLAGVFQTLRSGSVAQTVGSSMGMDVMLATVLGGMSIFGGSRSNAYSGLIGALTVAALNKGLLMVGVSSTLIQGVRGVIFLLLVLLNSERPKTLPSRQQF